MFEDVVPVQMIRSLANDDPADVVPVQIAVGEGLHHDEVLGCAEFHGGARFHLDHDGPSDGLLLKGKRSQGDVDSDACGGLQEKDPVPECKITGSLDAGLIMSKPFVDKGFLPSKSRQEGEIKVHGEAGFPPMENCDAADDAELPVPSIAEVLQLDRQLGEFIHAERILRKIRC